MLNRRSFVLYLVVLFSLALAGATLGIAAAMQSDSPSAADNNLQMHELSKALPAFQPDLQAGAVSNLPPNPNASYASNPSSSVWAHRNIPFPYDEATKPEGQLPEEFLRQSGDGALLAGRGNRGLSPSSMESNPPMPGDADSVICLSTERVWGLVSGGTVTVTVNGEQMGADLSNDIGYFWTTLYDSSGNRPGLASGDQVALYQDGVQLSSIALRSISGQFNAREDVVSGTIGGTGFPISVTVYVPGGEPSLTSYSHTVSTDASGNFKADFSADLDLFTWDEAVVGYIESGVEVHKHVYATPGLMVRPYPYNWVYGTAIPGTEVTVTVYLSDNVTSKVGQTVFAPQPSGFFFAQLPNDILESDIVYAELSNGLIMSRTIDKLTIQLDKVNDRITGEAEPGAIVRGELSDLTPLGWKNKTFSTTAEVSGAYTIDLSGLVDILPGGSASVMVADNEGDELNPRAFLPTIEVNQTWNNVYGIGSYQVGDKVNGSPVTLTLYSASSDSTSIYHQNLDWNGNYEFNQDNVGLPDIQPGDIVTVESGLISWQGVVEVKSMTVAADLSTDSFSGSVETPSDRVELSGNYWPGYLYPLGGQFDLKTTASSPYNANPVGIDVNYDMGVEVGHRTAQGYLERISALTGGFGVALNSNAVWASLAPPGSAFTITLYDSSYAFKAQITGTSTEPIGFIGWQNFWSTGEQILPGDFVQVQSDNGFDLTEQIPYLSLVGDPDTNILSGQAPPNALLLISSDPDGRGFVSSNSQGEFALRVDQFQEMWGDGDLQKYDYASVEYWTEHNTWITVDILWPQMRVNYAQDWVGANYEAGHTFTITVQDSGGNTKGKTTIESRIGGGWGGDGFQTEDWLLKQPDIQPGDWVYMNADDGYSNAIHVGTITGELDFAKDTINGTINASWFTEDLNMRCEVWVENGPDGIATSVNPNGGSYECDFNDVGWDLQPGQNVAVYYKEPDGDLVINVFPETRPHLTINKWADGNPAEGGNMLFKVRYWNNNSGNAENVVITDTLEGMSYITDTSGAGVSTSTIPGGEVVVLDLGSLPGNSQGFIEFFAHVDASQGEQVTNTVQIATSTEDNGGDPGEKFSTWSGTVQENDTDVTVGKYAWTGNPVPGYDFVYAVNACNKGSTNSASVTLTDTLPLSTTLVTWWGQHKGWSEVSRSDQQLVVSRPSLGGGQCTEVYIRVSLDSEAWQGMDLVNIATISADNDIDTGNNINEMRHNVGSARSTDAVDLSLRKQWMWGEYVPGGEMVYSLSYRNDGNTPVDGVKITSTLPASATFMSSWSENEYGRVTITPSLVTDKIVVWDIGTLDNGYEGQINVQVNFDWDAEPGTAVTHTVDINVLPEEFDTLDNRIVWSDTLQDYGPNLRVDKQNYRWNSEGQLQYELHIFNIGSETLENVYITDTYPISTTFDSWWVGHGPKIDATNNAPERQLVVWLEQLNPGDTANVIFQVNLDNEIINQQGLSFYNQVQAPIENDVDTSDNSDELTAYTGPDVFVEKWLSAGKVEPGELVTFTVKFGNKNRWPWDTDKSIGSHLTDTLPSELTFVRAVPPWNRDQDWNPEYQDGNVLSWGWGTMWAESTWFMQVVAQVTDTVQNGDVFTNTIAAYGDNPGDVELFWDNNLSSVMMTAEVHRFIYLPIVKR